MSKVRGLSYNIVVIRDEQGRSALMLTSYHGHSHCVSPLIRSGAGLEDTDTEGLTPLTHAIINNQLQSAAVLLQAGANVNCSDKSGRSGLDIAIYQAGVIKWTFFADSITLTLTLEQLDGS